VVVRRREVDRPGLDGLLVERLADGEPHLRLEDGGEQARPLARHVNDDEHRHGQVGAQRWQDGEQRLDGPRRGADGDRPQAMQRPHAHRSGAFL
jgi:hypothetical protein